MDVACSCEPAVEGQQLKLTDLGPGPLTKVLQVLSIPNVLIASQVCKTLHDAAAADSLWKHKALEIYPDETVVPLKTYSSYRELVQDDDKQNASLFLPLHDLSSEYKNNRYSYYFECLVLGLEWRRSDNLFRLYFDARGEPDLRTPLESSIGIVVRQRNPHPNRRVLKRRIAILQKERHALFHAHQTVANWLELGSLRRQLATNTALLAKANHELHDANDCLSFADLVSIHRPVNHKFLIQKPGHYMGYLEFDSLHHVDTLIDSLPASYPHKRQAMAQGLALVFCYANPIPVMPMENLADYYAVTILEVPPGCCMESAFKTEKVQQQQQYQQLSGPGAVVSSSSLLPASLKYTTTRSSSSMDITSISSSAGGFSSSSGGSTSCSTSSHGNDVDSGTSNDSSSIDKKEKEGGGSGRYVADGSVCCQLEKESEEERKVRWSDVVLEDILNRQDPPWYVE